MPALERSTSADVQKASTHSVLAHGPRSVAATFRELFHPLPPLTGRPWRSVIVRIAGGCVSMTPFHLLAPALARGPPHEVGGAEERGRDQPERRRR